MHGSGDRPTIRAILEAARPVLPVITITDPDTAVPLAEALGSGGIHVLEITLRTEAACAALSRLRRALPALCIGAGSVSNLESARRAVDSGAQFLVSPGFDAVLAAELAALDVPWLPGVLTPSEMMQASRLGFDTLKLFPADVAGGVALLRAVSGPLPQLRFCPTGGMTPHNLGEFLALPNVLCVGGSWIAPQAMIDSRDWQTIGTLAAALPRNSG
jgi:2-dehydro-3-deoxyphosphogluconate aldolase/(4S)-4-hydroxy-2-oxoglutarate aldolase